MRLKFTSDNLLRTWTGWKRTEQLEVFFRVNWLQNQSNLTVYRGNDISTGVNILAVEKRIKNRHVKSHKLKFWVFKNNMRNSQSCVRSVTIWKSLKLCLSTLLTTSSVVFQLYWKATQYEQLGRAVNYAEQLSTVFHFLWQWLFLLRHLLWQPEQLSADRRESPNLQEAERLLRRIHGSASSSKRSKITCSGIFAKRICHIWRNHLGEWDKQALPNEHRQFHIGRVAERLSVNLPDGDANARH